MKTRKCKYCGVEITEGIYQVVCRSCREKNTSKKAKEYQKRKADKQYMLGFEHGYQQGKTMSNACEKCKYKALAILHTGYKEGKP